MPETPYLEPNLHCVADVDYISLNCVLNWSYYASWALTMGHPIFVFLYLAVRVRFFDLSVDQLHQKSLTFLVIVYNGLATKCFQAFVCTKLADGTSMLLADPDITCYEHGHIWLMAGSVVFIVVYVAGIPVALAFILRYYQAGDKLTEEVDSSF